jgi:hypothetical protein
VQDREDDVDRAERRARAVPIHHRELALGDAVRPQDARAVVFDGGKLLGVQCEAGGVVRLQGEGAVTRDADRDDVVAVAIDGLKDAGCRRATDRMLA